MKKIVMAVTVAVLLISAVGVFAFADGESSVPQWFYDMVKWKNDAIDKAVEDGTMTSDQAEKFKDHLSNMEKYHEENGFDINEMHKGKRHGKRGHEVNPEEAEKRFNEMIESKKEAIKNALDEGKITQQGYDEYLKEIEEIEEKGFENMPHGPKGGFMKGKRPNGFMFGEPKNVKGEDL